MTRPAGTASSTREAMRYATSYWPSISAARACVSSNWYQSLRTGTGATRFPRFASNSRTAKLSPAARIASARAASRLASLFAKAPASCTFKSASCAFIRVASAATNAGRRCGEVNAIQRSAPRVDPDQSSRSIRASWSADVRVPLAMRKTRPSSSSLSAPPRQASRACASARALSPTLSSANANFARPSLVTGGKRSK